MVSENICETYICFLVLKCINVQCINGCICKATRKNMQLDFLFKICAAMTDVYVGIKTKTCTVTHIINNYLPVHLRSDV